MRSLNAIWKSFFSKSLYEEVAFEWKGIAFGYASLVVLILCIFYGVQTHFGVKRFIETEGRHVVSQVPSITIENGKARTPEAKAYSIYSLDKQLIAVIDTTQKQLPEKIDSQIFMSESGFVVNKSSEEKRVYNLSKVKFFELTQEKSNQWLDIIQKYTAFAVIVFMFVGLLVVRLIQALLFSLGGMVISKIKSVSLSYGALFRLSVVAMTPALIIFSIIAQFGIKIPFSELFYIGMTLGYIYFGLPATTQMTDRIRNERV